MSVLYQVPRQALWTQLWQNRQSLCSFGAYAPGKEVVNNCTIKCKLQDVIGAMEGEYKRS